MKLPGIGGILHVSAKNLLSIIEAYTMTTRGRRKKRRQRKIIAVCAVAAVLLAVITAVLIALVYKSGFGKDKGGSFYKKRIRE